VYQQGTNETPRQEGSRKHGDGRVETDEHSTPNEGRSDFNEPTPVVDVLSPVGVTTPDVKPKSASAGAALDDCGECGNQPSKDMPVIHDAHSIVRGNSVDEGTEEGGGNAFEFLHGILPTVCGGMHGPDGDCRCRGYVTINIRPVGLGALRGWGVMGTYVWGTSVSTLAIPG
jgi:hypothetical protein